jgi:site-specific DNA recombinase
MQPKAIGYTRVSTARQGNDGISLEMQEERIKALCQYKGFHYEGTYSDSVTGSGKEDRPGFTNVMQRVLAKDVQVIVVYSLSRFTRSTRELLDFVESYVITGATELHSVVEQLDTSSPTGRFMLKVMGAMNELEREQIVQRTQAALDHKKAKGEKLGGYIPYGYEIDNDGKTLILNHREQRVIFQIQSLFDNNVPLNQIAKVLNEKSIPTKNGYEWSHKSVSRVLKRI